MKIEISIGVSLSNRAVLILDNGSNVTRIWDVYVRKWIRKFVEAIILQAYNYV